MTALFTFGCGALGELGTTRANDSRRSDAACVAFDASVPNADQVEAVALGTDHSLALIGGHVFRWGLLGAHASPAPRRNAAVARSAPTVVPNPTPISDLASFVADAGTAEEERLKSHGSQGVTASRRHPDGRVRGIACGGSNSYMLTSDGEVFLLGSLWPLKGDPDCIRHLWGSGLNGPGTRVARIAAGWRHCLLLTEAGRVFAIGDDEHGQCAGISTGAEPVPVPNAEVLVGIAAGACHSLAWSRTGSAFAWGHGGSGRLGLGHSEQQRKPVRVAELPEPVCAASCGANFTIFVTRLGRSLWACGGNKYGQLGLGGSSASSREVPACLDFPRGKEEIISIACGSNHVLCLTCLPEMAEEQQRLQAHWAERAVVWAWGCTSSGQCGRAEGAQSNALPAECRRAPEALADFLMPTPHWALAVAAGRTTSAVLASIDGPLSRQLRASPLPQMPPAAVMEQEAPASLKVIEPDEDIIEAFCAGLLDGPEKQPRRHQSHSPAPTAFCSDVVDDSFYQQSLASSPGHVLQVSSPGHVFDFSPGHFGQYVDPARVSERISVSGNRRTQSPRIHASGASWPRPPPSWSKVGKSQSNSFTMAPGDRRTSPSKQMQQLQHRPSRSPRQPKGPPTTFPGRSKATSQIPTELEVPVSAAVSSAPVAPVLLLGPPDEWAGIHKSLDGLSSMISSIGMSTQPHKTEIETCHAGDSAAGGSRRPALAEEKADLFAFDFRSYPGRNNRNFGTATQRSKPGSPEKVLQLDRRDAAVHAPATANLPKLEFSSGAQVDEAGSDDGELDFSPMSAESSPHHRSEIPGARIAPGRSRFPGFVEQAPAAPLADVVEALASSAVPATTQGESAVAGTEAGISEDPQPDYLLQPAPLEGMLQAGYVDAAGTEPLPVPSSVHNLSHEGPLEVRDAPPVEVEVRRSIVVEQPLPPLGGTSFDAEQRAPPEAEASLAMPVESDVAHASGPATVESTWDVGQDMQSGRPLVSKDIEDIQAEAKAQLLQDSLGWSQVQTPQLPQLHIEALQAPSSIASSPQAAMEPDPLGAIIAPQLSVRSSVRSLASSPRSARSALSAVPSGPPASSQGMRFGGFAAASSKPPDAHVPSSVGSVYNDDDDETEESEDEDEEDKKEVNRLVADFATDIANDDASSSSDEEDDDDEGLLSGLGLADDSPAVAGTVQRTTKASPASTAEDDDDDLDASWV